MLTLLHMVQKHTYIVFNVFDTSQLHSKTLKPSIRIAFFHQFYKRFTERDGDTQKFARLYLALMSKMSKNECITRRKAVIK
jgi:hypothetical protein